MAFIQLVRVSVGF